VPEAVGVCEGVRLPLCETLGVALALAPGDREAVALEESVELALSVELGVTAPVPVALLVADGVALLE